MPFCQYCGKQLADGDDCDCAESQAHAAAAAAQQQPQPLPQQEPAAQPAYQPAPPPPQWQGQPAYQPAPGTYYVPPQNPTAQAFKGLFVNTWCILKSFFKSPSATLAAACKDQELPQGIFFLIIKALIAGIFVPFMISAVLNHMLGFFGGFHMGAGGYFGIFFRVLLFSLVFDAVYFAVLFLAGKFLFKSEVTAKGLLAALGTASLPLSVTVIVAWLLILINAQMGLFVLGLLLCYCAAVGFMALHVSLNLKADKLLYTMAIAFAVMFIVCYIAGDSMLSGLINSLTRSITNSFDPFGGLFGS